MIKRWQYVGIFLVACAVRALFAAIYFGGCDVNSFINIPRYIYGNNLPEYYFWNYFPAVTFYLWLSGLVSIVTPLPIALCAKVVPIFFDALIAVLVADCAQRLSGKRLMMTMGWLYALCPVPIIVVCIHGQYDSLFLFFLLLSFYVREFFADSYLKYFVFGALFGYALLLKTVVLGFLPFFFVPRKGIAKELGAWWRIIWIVITSGVFAAACDFAIVKMFKIDLIQLLLMIWPLCLVYSVALCGLLVAFLWWFVKIFRSGKQPHFVRYCLLQLTALAGLKMVMLIGFYIFSTLGFHWLELIDTTLRYCNQGVQLYGLPLAFPSALYYVALLLKNRIWLVALLGVLAVVYYKQRVDIFGVLSISFALIMGFSGFCPQYLMWLVPFFLLLCLPRWAAVYTFICTVFALIFYANPLSNLEVPYQSGLSFAPLSWLPQFLPPAWCASQALLPVLLVLGNFVIPALCIGFVVVQLCRMLRGTYPVYKRKKQTIFVLSNGYLVTNFCVAGVIIFLMYWYRHSDLLDLYQSAVAAKQWRYIAVKCGARLGTVFNGDPWCNIIVGGFIAMVLWCWWAVRIAHRFQRATNDVQK